MTDKVNPHSRKPVVHKTGDERKELANAELTENYIAPGFQESVKNTYKELHSDRLKKFAKNHKVVHKSKHSQSDLNVARASHSIIQKFGHSSYAKVTSSTRDVASQYPHKKHKPEHGR